MAAATVPSSAASGQRQSAPYWPVRGRRARDQLPKVTLDRTLACSRRVGRGQVPEAHAPPRSDTLSTQNVYCDEAPPTWNEICAFDTLSGAVKVWVNFFAVEVSATESKA